MTICVPTTLRAWPLPSDIPPGCELAAALDETDHNVFETESFRRVLAVDAEDAPGGINAYARLIAALRDAQVNVFAENKAGPGVPARFERCAMDGSAVRRRLEPDTRTPVVTLDELIVACCEAGGATCGGPIGLEQIDDGVLVRTVRRLFQQPAIPEGVRRPDASTESDAF